MYRNLDQFVFGTFLFAHSLGQFACRLTSGQSDRTRDLQTERSFSMMQDFGKAQKLSVCHKLVKCYGNLQDKF